MTIEAQWEKRRERECPSRHHRQCERINAALGWTHGLNLGTCDACYGAGPESPAAASLRSEVVSRIVRELSSPAALGRIHPGIARVVLERHINEEARRAAMTDPAIRHNIARDLAWEAARPLWERATEFLAAVVSGLGGLRKTEPAIKERRHISCTGRTLAGDTVADPCPSLDDDHGTQYCGACGCQRSTLTQISVLGVPGAPSKLDFPLLPCPRRRDGFTNQETVHG